MDKNERASGSGDEDADEKESTDDSGHADAPASDDFDDLVQLPPEGYQLRTAQHGCEGTVCGLCGVLRSSGIDGCSGLQTKGGIKASSHRGLMRHGRFFYGSCKTYSVPCVAATRKPS